MTGDASSTAPRPESVELRVARLVKAHGLKGGMKLELYTDAPELRFTPGAVFKVQVPTDSAWFGKTIRLLSIREINSHPVAFFEGVEERSVAETLVKAILWVEHDPTQAPPEKDAWFDHQLVGMTVVRDGAKVGVVIRVEHFPAQDLLVIDREGTEVLVPFVQAFVPEVDLEKAVITITPPGGLLEPLEGEETA